jgi:hypothetical protein
MAFLEEQSPVVLFEPPEGYEDAQSRNALTSEDIVFAKERRRSHNRVGFAIQLALVRDLGRPLRASEVPPPAVVSVVADQLGIDPTMFGLYAQREETRREHAREIVAALGLQPVRTGVLSVTYWNLRVLATCLLALIQLWARSKTFEAAGNPEGNGGLRVWNAKPNANLSAQKCSHSQIGIADVARGFSLFGRAPAEEHW